VYNVSFRRFVVIIFALEKQEVCVSSLGYVACNVHVLHCRPWLNNNFSHIIP